MLCISAVYEDMMLQDLFGSTEAQAEKLVDAEQVALQEYLFDEKKPLHTSFVLPYKGSNTFCPVYFGSVSNKQKVLDALCNELHSKLFKQWGLLKCYCGLVPILKLSQTPRNLNKVFLCCPKGFETRCKYFQWIHQPPKPTCLSKEATPSALKKERMTWYRKSYRNVLK